jgi:hypothetical protein
VRLFIVFILVLVFILATVSINANEYLKGYIDTVYSFTPGRYVDNPNYHDYFPENIFGPPSAKATVQVPASSMADVLPIGFEGEIIVGFKGKALVNGPGYDFIIFENPFINPINKGIFAEPGIVSVSQDGINFIEFPYDPNSLEGLAGLTPVYGSRDPFIHPACGGDAFDLELLGLSYITHIKIKDTTSIVTTLPKDHKYYNPEHIVSGFDLDAVSARYLVDISSVSTENLESVLHIRQYNETLQILSSCHDCFYQIIIYNLFGIVVLNDYIQVNQFVNISEFPAGIYLCRILDNSGNIIFTDKFIK